MKRIPIAMIAKLVLLTALLAFVRQGVSIDCYECDSNVDRRCGLESFPENYGNAIINCVTRTGNSWKTSTFCRTTIENVTNSGETNIRIKRECAWNSFFYEAGNVDKLMSGNLSGTICTDRPGVFRNGKQVKSCVCKTSLCNWDFVSSWTQLEVNERQPVHSQATATDTREGFKPIFATARQTVKPEHMPYALEEDATGASAVLKVSNAWLLSFLILAIKEFLSG